MEENNLKPINTQYKGFTFRSRLEARYAVMFDELGWEWEYEPEGFQLESGWYLPDFYFPGIGIFAEVKARQLNESELNRCLELSKAEFKQEGLDHGYGFQVLLLEGQPECKPYRVLGGGKFLKDAYLFDRKDKYFPLATKNSDPFQTLYLTEAAVAKAKSARFEFLDSTPKQETPPEIKKPEPIQPIERPKMVNGRFSLSDLKNRK